MHTCTYTSQLCDLAFSWYVPYSTTGRRACRQLAKCNQLLRNIKSLYTHKNTLAIYKGGKDARDVERIAACIAATVNTSPGCGQCVCSHYARTLEGDVSGYWSYCHTHTLTEALVLLNSYTEMNYAGT